MDSERRAVLSVLSRYEAAYSSLNADAAAAVYPEIDKRALARAFEALDAQNVRLKQCEIEMGTGTARAACFGTASWTPRVGNGRQAQDRRWDFALRQSAGVWTIDSVRIR
jgi:hypothetical protein